VAAVAGFSVDRLDLDFDRIELQITAGHGQGSVSFPELKLQLKCTSRDVIDGDRMRFPLKVKNYNDLRRNVLIPRILVVVLVIDIEIFREKAMQGLVQVMLTHVTVADNLLALLRNHVRGSGCRVYMSDMKVRIES
jgi:hypothetical protein